MSFQLHEHQNDGWIYVYVLGSIILALFELNWIELNWTRNYIVTSNLVDLKRLDEKSIDVRVCVCAVCAQFVQILITLEIGSIDGCVIMSAFAQCTLLI